MLLCVYKIGYSQDAIASDPSVLSPYQLKVNSLEWLQENSPSISDQLAEKCPSNHINCLSIECGQYSLVGTR